MNGLIFTGDATPMESLLSRMTEHSIMAVALIATVIVFLRQSKSRDDAFEKQQERWAAMFDERLEKSEIAARDGHQCIRENTKALGEISSLLRDKKV